MKTTLFKTKRRERGEAMKYGENWYEFIDESSRTRSAGIRDRLNQMVKKLPQHEQKEIISRIKDPRNLSGALYELYIHEELYKLDPNIHIHEPNLVTTNAKPDFYIEKPVEAIVEVSSVQNNNQNDLICQFKINQVARFLNKTLPELSFYLSINIKKASMAGIKLSEISKTVLQWEAKNSNGESYKYNKNGNILVIEQIGKKDNPLNRTVGIMHTPAIWVSDTNRIKSNIKNKLRKYRGATKPFILLLFISNWHTEQEDIEIAINGNRELGIRPLWEESNTKISAIYVLNHCDPNNPQFKGKIYKNPNRKFDDPNIISIEIDS